MGAPASQTGLAGAEAPEPCGLGPTDGIPSAEWKAGYAAGCAWYADYIQRVAEIRSKSFADADMWWPKNDTEFAYEDPEHWARENCVCPDDLPQIVEFETGYRGGNCFALIRPLPQYGEFDVHCYADKASAIEAASAGETTKIGSTEGESATRKGNAHD